MTAREPLMSKVRAQWPQAAPNAVVWIAYSGGADSTALLALAAELRDEGLITDLRAVHVHHGLSPQADVWGEHCLAVANRLGVVLEIKRIDVTEYKEGGLEAAAREGRYKAIQQVMDKDDVVVTAHHLQDQAETVLLRLFRGAGVEGLVGMSKRRSFGPGWLVRPLLGISQDEMANWLRGTPLPWIEDPMNVDEHLDRVYLRKSVMPVVRRRWAAADRVIARSAAHHATAVRALRQAGYEHDRQPQLSCDVLKGMEPGECSLTVRAWLKSRGVRMPPQRRLDELVHQALSAAPDRNPSIELDGHTVRRFNGQLYVVPKLPPPGSVHQPIDWDGERRVVLPSGLLGAVRCQGMGVSHDKLNGARLMIRFRQGGEVCQVTHAGPHKALKGLFQEWRVPPWERAVTPLLFLNGVLVCVVGHVVAEAVRAHDGEDGWMFSWEIG